MKRYEVTIQSDAGKESVTQLARSAKDAASIVVKRARGGGRYITATAKPISPFMA